MACAMAGRTSFPLDSNQLAMLALMKDANVQVGYKKDGATSLGIRLSSFLKNIKKFKDKF